MTEYEKAGLFERLKKGLKDSAAYSRGELSLRTVELPAPPPSVSPRRVVALRHRLKMSQAVFAATLNVSPKLVQSWEQGTRQPSRGDLRLIQIVERDPQIILGLLAPVGTGQSLSSTVSAKPTRARRVNVAA